MFVFVALAYLQHVVSISAYSKANENANPIDVSGIKQNPAILVTSSFAFQIVLSKTSTLTSIAILYSIALVLLYYMA